MHLRVLMPFLSMVVPEPPVHLLKSYSYTKTELRSKPTGSTLSEMVAPSSSPFLDKIDKKAQNVRTNFARTLEIGKHLQQLNKTK